MPDTSVKYFHSAMPGAPVLSGTAGSLIAVLDACLVNGFAVSAVASIVVAGNIATATISAGHSAEVGSVVLVSGATPSGLNGEKKVLTVGGGNTVLTFDATGISDQTATGTISLKLAGAGWAKSFSGTNLAAYKSGDVAATGCYLRVDDTGAKVARCVGYGTMTAISAGGNMFPGSWMRAGGTYWTKSTAADSSRREWTLVADDRIFYLLTAYHLTYPMGGAFVAFGDLNPASSADAWACAISGYASDKSGSAPGDTNDYGVLRAAADELYIARLYTTAGISTAFKAFPLIVPSTSTGFASGNGPMLYPNGPDSGLYLGPHYVIEGFVNCLRGVSPGLYCCPQNLPPSAFAANSRIEAADNLLGKTLRAATFGAGGATAAVVFFDVDGPWR